MVEYDAFVPLRRSSALIAFAATTTIVGTLATVASGCSVGEGSGSATGTLNVQDCWSGKFNLEPDFFAGVPYRRSLELRIQEGGDYTTYSDGLNILVRDIDSILGNAKDNKKARLGEALAVRIPSSVTPPGVPVTPDPDPAIIDIALYLQRTCKLQNVPLYAGTVSLNKDGTCEGIDNSAVECPTSTTEAQQTSQRIAQSTITFQHLFNGIPEEPEAGKRLTEASFDIYLADPREICPGGLGPPPRCRGHLTGSFRFTFERGRPAQRFP